VAEYTAVNLREVDNQGHNFGIEERDFELRMARVALDCQDCGVTYQRLAPNWRQPYGHRHKRQEEIFVLVTGSARMKLDDEVVDMNPWTAIRVPSDTMRSIESGPEGAELIAIGAPNTGPGDGITEPGWWKD
jgi:mannose-6-phosphate isomerase-like protein (cupin superfamily)